MLCPLLAVTCSAHRIPQTARYKRKSDPFSRCIFHYYADAYNQAQEGKHQPHATSSSHSPNPHRPHIIPALHHCQYTCNGNQKQKAEQEPPSSEQHYGHGLVQRLQ